MKGERTYQVEGVACIQSSIYSTLFMGADEITGAVLGTGKTGPLRLGEYP